MVFYFYEEAMRDVAKISVDGLVPNSFHLSHWRGNQTPTPLKADTATEIALRYLAHPARKTLFPHVSIITNNHFDTDGLLAVWSLLNPRRAEPMAGRLIAAAEAGDFSIFSSEEGVQVNLLINALCRADESPIMPQIQDYKGPLEGAYYKALLPIVFDLFQKKEEYSAFWKVPFEKILHGMTHFEKGIVGVEEHEEEGLTVVIDEERLLPQAIDHYCMGNLFLVVEDRHRHEGGFGYELEYRYYAWADTVTRPQIPSIPMGSLVEILNDEEGKVTSDLEKSDLGEDSLKDEWKTDGFTGQSKTSALKFTNEKGARGLSRLHPEYVIQTVLNYLKSDEARTH
ncbi:MAG: DUF6687 family protein [Nitrospiria bacterium]